MSRSISMTAELLGENKSGAAFAEMSQDIRELDRELDRLEREIRVGLELDDRATADVKAADAALDKWDGREATATIALKDKASGNLRYAFSYLDSWGESEMTATIRLKDEATRPLRIARAHLAAWDGDEATATLKVKDRATGSVREANRVLDSFDGEDATAELDARDQASPKIQRATSAADAFERTNPTAEVDADTADASAGFAKVTGEAAAVGRLEPTVEVDADTAGATAQLLAFQGTAVSTTAATSTLTKSMFSLTSPLALGGIAAAAVAAAAAVGPLAAGLAVAGTAGVAAASGIGLLAGAIAPSIVQIAKWKEGTEAARSANEAAKTATDSYRAAVQSLGDAQKAVSAAERGVAEARRSAAQQTASAVDAYKSSLEDVEEAARGVQAAERGVADARRSAAQSVQSAVQSYEDSLEGVEDAEQSLEDSRRALKSSTDDLRSAQEDLNEALADEPRNMAELELSVKEARLQQAEATLDVADAQKELNAARRSGDPEEIRRAELDLQAARLSTERASLSEAESEDELADARRKGTSELRAAREGYKSALEARRSAARGVTDSEEALADSQKAASRAEAEIQRARAEGARSIREAQRGVTSAQRALAESQEEAAKAEKAISQTRAEGARQVQESQRAVADAQRQAARAADAVADAAEDVAAANKKAERETVGLSAANRALYRAFRELGPAYRSAFKGANREANEFGQELLGLAKRPLPALGREAKETVGSVRREFKGLRSDLGGREKDSLLGILDASSDILGDLVRAGGRTFGGLANLVAEIVPDAKSFSQYLSDISGDFLRWSRTEDTREKVHTWLKNAKPVARELAEFLGDAVGYLINFGNKHGDEFADALDLVGDSLDALFGKKKTDKREKDAARAGAATGSAYSKRFVGAQEKAAKEEGPSLGERWGRSIGGGLTKVVKGVLLTDVGKGGAGDFVEGFIDGLEKNDITAAEFKKALFGTKNPSLSDLVFGHGKNRMTFKFEGSPVDNMIEAIEKGLNRFNDRVQKWGKDLRGLMVSPFRWAYDKIVGNSIVPDLIRDTTKAFDGLPGKIGRAIKGIPGDVTGIFKDAARGSARQLGDLAKSADEKTHDAQKWISSHLSEGRKRGLEELGILKEDGTLDLEGLRKGADEKMDAARKSVRDHLEAARDKGKAALDTLRKDGLPDLDDLRKGASEKTDAARQAVKDHLEAARDVGKAALEVLRDKGAEAMKEARDRWTEPVKSSSTDQQGFMNNMLYGMGQVIEKAGLDLKKPEQFKVLSQPGGADRAADEQMGRPTGLAAGGVVDARGVLRLAAGGIADEIFARGGDLRGPRQSRLIEVGEGDHDEAVIAITKNPALRPNQEHYMRVGADLIGGAFVSAAELQARRIESFAKVGFANGGLAGVPGGRLIKDYGADHHGWDVAASPGTPVFAPAAGQASNARYLGPYYQNQQWGTMEGFNFVMAHLSSAKGSGPFSAGERLGVIGPSDDYTPHVHWAFRDDGAMPPRGNVDPAAVFGSLRGTRGPDETGAGHRPASHGGGGDPVGDRWVRGGNVNTTNIHISGGGSHSVSTSESGGDDARADREFRRIWRQTTSAMPSWVSGVLGMEAGGVLPGVPIWREGGGSPAPEDPRAEELLRNPPTWKMPKLAKRTDRKGGGEGLGATMHTYIPEMQAFVDGAEKKFPSTFTNTYSNHPMGFPQPHFRERSVDFWGSGYRGNPIPLDTGEQVVAHAIDKLAGDLNWLIFEGKMLDAGGWGPDTSGFSHAGRQRHVHITAFADHSKANASAAGGFATVDIRPLIEKHIKPVPDHGKGLPNDSAENLSKKARTAIVAKLEAAAAQSGGGSFGSAKDLRGWVEAGLKVDDLFPASEENVRGYMDLAQTESSGNPRAVQQITDINSTMGGAGGFQDNLARGLLQNTPQSWEGNRDRYGQDPGKANPNIFDPVKSVAMRARNQKAALGHISFTPGYRGGGYILEDHLARVHKDELYLDLGKDPRAASALVGFLKNTMPRGFDSPDLRQEYERRIAAFEGRGPIGDALGAPRGGRSGAGGGSGGGSGGVERAIERMEEGLREEMRQSERRNTEAIVGALRSVGVDPRSAREIGERVKGGQDHNLERDQDTRDAAERGRRHLEVARGAAGGNLGGWD